MITNNKYCQNDFTLMRNPFFPAIVMHCNVIGPAVRTLTESITIKCFPFGFKPALTACFHEELISDTV
jgi:hypothetical protein